MKRLLWGIERVSVNKNEKPLLLFQGWAGQFPPRYPDEPSWPLLFMRRQDARIWAASKTAFYGNYPEGHVCHAWRFRVVRVVEQVKSTEAR